MLLQCESIDITFQYLFIRLFVPFFPSHQAFASGTENRNLNSEAAGDVALHLLHFADSYEY